MAPAHRLIHTGYSADGEIKGVNCIAAVCHQGDGVLSREI